MEKTLMLAILYFLYDEGINVTVDIYPIVKKFYPKHRDYGSYIREDEINRYLAKIHSAGYIDYRISYKEDSKAKKLADLDMIIFSHITISGYRFTVDLKRDQSVIDTNNSIISTSKKQTIILAFALLLSLIGLVISWLNYRSTFKIEQGKEYLLLSKGPIKFSKKDTLSQHSEKHSQNSIEEIKGTKKP